MIGLISWSTLAESVVVDDVLEMADYNKGDICYKVDETIEVDEYDVEDLDSFYETKVNKHEL